jgi:ubiquinone biosynthesis protein
VPSELTVLGKTLLQLDEVGRTLDPGFDTTASIRRNAGEITSQRMSKGATQGSILNSMLEMKDFVTGLPARLTKILDTVSNAELEVKVRVTDAKLFMEGLQKIANRIATGIILASLIVGASLLMRVDTPFRIFGYPGLAMLLFLAAAAGGFWLVIGIYVQDRRSDKKASRSSA